LPAAARRQPLVAAPFRALLTRLKRQTTLPIYLPSALPYTVAQQRLYASGTATADSYEITLTSRAQCGANSCFVGMFTAQRSHTFTPHEAPDDATQTPAKQVVLEHAIPAYYRPLSCGGSCTPPSIEWVTHGVLYRIQFAVDWRTTLTAQEAERLMVALANSALKVGTR